jgi:hypothetical protein
MGKMLISVDDELEMRIRRLALEKYGKRRGGLSRVVEEALKLLLENEKKANDIKPILN